MAASETVFEYLALALEATKGTAVSPPTHVLPLEGMITPVQDMYRPVESRGTLAEFYRSKPVRNSATWSGSSGLDPNYAPLLFNMAVKAVTAPTTPTNGILTRLWTFAPTMTSDDLKSATLYWGDPNVQIWQSAYAMVDTIEIAADASGTDGATWDVSGYGRYPTRVAAPVLPAQAIGDLLMPGSMQMWMDTSSAIGTTEVTGRFISTGWTIPAGTVRKHYAGGIAGNLNFTKHGRTRRHATAKIRVELNDVSIGAGKEYLTYEAGTVAKVRIRLNGSLIESVTPDYHYFVELDIYGPLSELAWGDVEGANRTMEFTIQSQYDSTAGHDFALRVQNAKTAL